MGEFLRDHPLETNLPTKEEMTDEEKIQFLSDRVAWLSEKIDNIHQELDSLKDRTKSLEDQIAELTTGLKIA